MTSPVRTSALGRARVVLLAGPSGAGKSRLADRLHGARGWPVVHLDDFYKDCDDPTLPQHPSLGIPDWDHPDSWDSAGAMAALSELVETGAALVPTYDISTSSRTGTTRLAAGGQDLILAEGIFAYVLARPLQQAGLLHSAWCVRNSPAMTFLRRLARDLKERRKPPLVLVRRGWALMRDEPAVVARAAQAGARPARARDVEALVTGSDIPLPR